MALRTRAKSPTRTEAIAGALRPRAMYSSGVLLGNWVEDRIECPKQGTLYFPPKDDTETSTLKAEWRQPDLRLNKLSSTQGTIQLIIPEDSHDSRPNYATTNDLVYRHLPKPLCGPQMRYYRRGTHSYCPEPDLLKCYTEWLFLLGLSQWRKKEPAICLSPSEATVWTADGRGTHRYCPEPDLLKCYGNITEWGLRVHKQYEWACTDVSDYTSSLYEDTYVAPLLNQYLTVCDRKGHDSSFTKTFRFKMTKPLAKPKKQ